MNINLANIDFCPGGKSATLTETTAEILLTETEKVIVPPEGTDGFNKVTITHAPVEESVSATITSNGTHTITPSAGFGAMVGVNVDVNIPSVTDDKIQYFYKKPTADDAGLKAIGWTDDDVNYYKYNTYAYPWEADKYKVSDANKQITINSVNDIATYKDNPDFQYCPMFDMGGMTMLYEAFGRCRHIIGIPRLDTSKATYMASMFEGCSSLTSIPLLDTSNATNMSHMFYVCKSLTSVPLLDTHSVTNMSYMFASCSSLTSIPLLDASNVTDMGRMFSDCTLLTSVPQLNTSKVTSMSNMFTNCSSLTTIPLLDTSKITHMNEMFGGCTSLTSVPQLNTSNVEVMTDMFSSCKSLASIPHLDTSKVTWMQSMFEKCSSLTTIPLLDTGNVKVMKYMFSGCTSLTTIPQLNTSKVTDMSNMFANCSSLTSIPKLDATSLTNTGSMFGPYYYPLNKFTTFGGLTNLKVNLDLSTCKNLTHDSLMNVINEAADVTASPKTLTLGATNLAKLTDDEKAIATNKGWTLA